MNSEREYISSAVRALGDRHATPAPIFFDQKVEAAIDGKSLDDALDALRKLIDEAALAKEFGSGPPQSNLNAARRRWNQLYEIRYGRAA